MGIQIIGKTFFIEDGTVNISDVDISQVLAEFPVEEVLDTLDYNDILDYVSKTEKERIDEQGE
jgi:hypothetical protein